MSESKHFSKINNNSFNRNAPFYMISDCFPQIVYRIMNEYPKAMLVLAVLMDCSSNYGTTIISQRVISKNIKNISPSTVSKAVNYLSTNGYIKVITVKGKSLYVINSNIFWHTSVTTKKKISNDMGFLNTKQLTEGNNAAYPYFLRHLRIEHEKKSNILNPKLIDNIRYAMINYHNNRKRLKFMKSRSLRQAKNDILSRFHKIRFTNKERKVSYYVMKKLINGMDNSTKSDPPVLPYSNKTLRSKIMSDESQDDKDLKLVSYAVVARAMFKLHRHGIIRRKRVHNGSHYSSEDGCIMLDPIWMPLKKDKINKKQLRYEKISNRLLKSFNRLIWKRYHSLTQYIHKIRLSDINEYFRLKGAFHAWDLVIPAQPTNVQHDLIKLKDKASDVRKFIKQVQNVQKSNKYMHSHSIKIAIKYLRNGKQAPDFSHMKEKIYRTSDSNKIFDISCLIFKKYKNMSEDKKDKYSDKYSQSFNAMMEAMFK